jgi:hypothetical protein
MRPRLPLLISISVNLVLAMAFFVVIRHAKVETAELSYASPPSATNGVAKTNVVVRRENFTWAEIESNDYQTYIKNLRAIGCPEPTVRDIIVAEINSLFERRRATEVITGEQQWWRSVPDPQVIAAATFKLQELAAERRTLLTELLGPNWENTNNVPSGFTAPILDGPILGKLSPEVKQAIRDIELRASQTLSANADGSGDTPALAKARLDVRAELAKILDPTQLEEYLLRYSSTAQAMRNELKGLNVTADEFRAVFRVRDRLDQDYLNAVASEDALRVAQRDSSQKQSEDSIRQALGEERYQLYRYTRDPSFRRVQTLAEEIGAPPEVVVPVYQINQATNAERQRIRNDQSLTPEQREAAIETVLVQQKESLRKILGDQLYEDYEGERQN